MAKHWYLSMNKTSPGNVGRTMFVNFSYSEKWCDGLQSWSLSRSRRRHLDYLEPEPEPGENGTAPHPKHYCHPARMAEVIVLRCKISCKRRNNHVAMQNICDSFVELEMFRSLKGQCHEKSCSAEALV